MPLSQVHAGMDCTGETVIQGTTITSFGVHVIDIVQDSQQGPRILVSVSGPAVDRTGVAEGFSGSPVLCDDGTGTERTIGAISASVGEYGNKVVLVTPIEQMLGEPIAPPSGAPRLAIRGRPLATPFTVGGLSAPLQALVERAARRLGRTVLAGPASSTLAFPVQDLVPGASVSAMYATGAVTVGAVGTVSYRNGTTIYAFGHPLDDVGRRSLMLGDAYVYDVIASPSNDAPSYKLAAPGHTLGTLTSDTPNAIIGTTGPPPPPSTSIDVTARDLDTGRRLALHGVVADETDIGNPSGGSLLSTAGPLIVAQAGSAIYDGPPANETGRMCLTVDVRELRAPLRFCNRYVGSAPPGSSGSLPPILALLSSTDVTTALGLFDAQTFARLHATHVQVSLDAQRGLREATIIRGSAPTRVRAGQRVGVALTVRRYRAGFQTIRFAIRIPSDARGHLVARLGSSSSSGSADSLANALVSTLFGGSSPAASGGSTTSGPTSLSALRSQFTRVGRYDGLLLRFGKRAQQHSYRDPNLLLTGHTQLTFTVTK